MSHHGMNKQHGIDAMCTFEKNHEGRFGRLFPSLSPSYVNPQELKKLGAKGGPMDGKNISNPSQTIPMGFVFLGQFIDHDITLDTTSELDRVNDPKATQNFRTPALDLDCIYGSGPEASEFLYREDKVHLNIGVTSTALDTQADNLKVHDLSRTSSGVAIIGDPRNDENRVISQLQLAFIRFHNRVVDHVISEKGYKQEDLRKGAVRKEVFEEARQTVVWHYHWIILNEFLPLIAGKPIVDRILGEGRRFYNPKRSFIPIEFAAAAYRFGHSLAPKSLKINNFAPEADLFSRELGFGFSPITNINQFVQWNTMFENSRVIPTIPGVNNSPTVATAMTEKLDLKLSTDLLDLPFVPQGGEKSLANRNLLRGQSFLLPSGEKIAELIGVDENDRERTANHIANVSNGIDLSSGTPLWFYILAEAATIGRQDEDTTKPGEGLGPVGATIVAETIIGLIEKDANSYLSQNRSWTPTLLNRFFNTESFTITDLINFPPPPPIQ